MPSVIKRVLHFVPAYFGQRGVVGGAERYALELAKAMASKVETSLVSFGEKDEEFFEDSLRVRIFGAPYRIRGQANNGFHSGVLREMLKSQVVHCHQQHLVCSSLLAACSMLLRKKCFVSDLGGGAWDISAYISTDSWYRGHLHISEYSRKVFKHEHRTNASVILGGVDYEKFCPDPTIAKEDMVIFTGRLLPHKGINDLVEALPHGLKLVLVGRPYHAEFLELLKKMAVGRDIHFMHECSDEQLVDLYRRSICVILPSVYKTCYGVESPVPELLGQTLLEGMACGTAAICTDVASMPEVVEDGKTGFVVPPNDPVTLRQRLVQLRDDRELVQNLGYAGRARILEHFTWQKVVDRCLRAYSE